MENEVLLMLHPSSSLSSDSREIVGVQFKGSHFRALARHAAFPHLLLGVEHAFVVVRNDAHELWQPLVPPKQYLGSACAAGMFSMTKDHVLNRLDLFWIFEASKLDHLFIATADKI